MSALRLSLYQPREQSAYHPSHGTVDVDGAGMKFLGLRMKDADVPLWREVIKAISVELDLRKVVKMEELVLPVPVDLNNRVCTHCGCTLFHQPQGRSTIIECNRCGAQCEGGAGQI